MQIVVQKFGGTSVANLDGRLSAVKHVERALEEGKHIIVVVSAMGRFGDVYSTDTLLQSVGDRTSASPRDLDLLMACGETISAVTFATLLRSRGHHVTVFNGLQAGIVTNDHHGDARIIGVKPDRIVEALSAGHIAVVTGFQGATENGEVTTLGRGGSDTTACVLGAALNASSVDIFSDVDGVMTADPRIVSDAGFVDRISYSEICELAYHGAKVIHPYAVEAAMVRNVPIHIRNTAHNRPGTVIGSVNDTVVHQRSHRQVIGVAGRKDAWLIEFASAADAIVGQSELSAHFNDDEIRQTSDRCSLLTPFNHDEQHVSHVIHKLQAQRTDATRCAQVSVICSNGCVDMQNSFSARFAMAQALSDMGVHEIASGASGHAIWWLVPKHHLSVAMRCLHDTFELGLTVASVAVGAR